MVNKMNILAIIPARGGSKGIPGKNIKKINGKPLLQYTINASLNSKFISKTIVSTDDDKIAKIAKKLKVDVIIRPKNLANDKAQIEPTMEHVLKKLKTKEGYVPDVIILLQNTSPLRTSKHIDNAFKKFKDKKLDSVLSASFSHQFIWRTKKELSKPLNYDPNHRQNRQELSKDFKENGAIYITKYQNFMKSKCRVSGKIGIFEMPEHRSFEVDSKIDFSIIEFLLKIKKLE
jgi:CMP-N,N'-diacetyllegionaminic acid synthase